MNYVKVALAFVLAGVVLPVQASEAGKPLVVHLQAALDVDREGRVAAVTYVDERDVPDAIRQHGEQIAMGWKFVPPMKDGKAVSGRTYAEMQVCLAPRGDSMDVSILYAGNGPASFYEVPRKPVSLAFPIGRLVARGINELRGKIVFVVSVDGKAQLESATLEDAELQKRYGHLWSKDQRAFLKRHRYLPELIDGVPTATRMESTIENTWRRAEDRKAVAAEMRDKQAQSDACKALTIDPGRQIAIDSAFQRVEG